MENAYACTHKEIRAEMAEEVQEVMVEPKEKYLKRTRRRVEGRRRRKRRRRRRRRNNWGREATRNAESISQC